YMALANQPSETRTDRASRQLLVLDLNGTLLSRTKNRKSMYTRPHVDAFLHFVFAHFQVMVWSSAGPGMVENMLQLFGDYRAQLFAVWTRHNLGLNPKDYNRKVQTYKNLDRLIESPLLHDKGFYFHNIILLDDSPRKVSKQPYNCVPIKTFSHYNPEFGVHGDCELLRAIDYLELLANETNVPGYIKAHPF
ncbi:HAD-like protein, partial [Hesseltinella vesiculosa]